MTSIRAVPAAVLLRILRLKDPNRTQTGSGFVVEIDGTEYICSANHLFDASPIHYIEIRHAGQWRKTKVRVIGRGTAEYGVIVFQATDGFRRIPQGDHLVKLTDKEMFYTQDAYVLGYPFGWDAHKPGVNDDWPLPIVKSAIISLEPSHWNSQELLIDCEVNPGFSGGPIALNILGTANWAFVGVATDSYRCARSIDADGAQLEIDEATGFSRAIRIQTILDFVTDMSNS